MKMAVICQLRIGPFEVAYLGRIADTVDIMIMITSHKTLRFYAHAADATEA
jgi:hypothetical protein